MNLAEFPITVLADRAPQGAKTLIFHAGQGQLTITGSDAFGLPTALGVCPSIAFRSRASNNPVASDFLTPDAAGSYHE